MYSSAVFYVSLQYILTFFLYAVLLENVAVDSRRDFSHYCIEIRQDRI